MDVERGQNTALLPSVSDACIDGDDFKPVYNEQCTSCPLSILSMQVAHFMPRNLLKTVNKRGLRQQLDYPDRPAVICGIVWDLQHAQAW